MTEGEGARYEYEEDCGEVVWGEIIVVVVVVVVVGVGWWWWWWWGFKWDGDGLAVSEETR